MTSTTTGRARYYAEAPKIRKDGRRRKDAARAAFKAATKKVQKPDRSDLNAGIRRITDETRAELKALHEATR